EPRALFRQPVAALGQPLRDRPVLRPDHHPHDLALRAVRHPGHRARVMTAVVYDRPSGDFKTSYAADDTIFPTRTSAAFCVAGIVLVCLAPLYLGKYGLSILIQIGYLGIAALGLNILV